MQTGIFVHFYLLVKNCEGSGILPLLASQQFNLLWYHGCWLRVLRQRQRALLLRPCRVAHASCLSWFSFILTSHGNDMEQPGWMLGITTEESNPSYETTCTTFAQEGDTLYKNPWKDSLEQKLSVTSASSQVQKPTPMENCLPALLFPPPP